MREPGHAAMVYSLNASLLWSLIVPSTVWLLMKMQEHPNINVLIISRLPDTATMIRTL